MDTVTAAVIVVAILAVVALVAIIMYRERLKLSMGANKLEFDGSNSPSEPVSSPAQATPAGGARVSDVEAGKNISARDETGAGASIDHAKAKGGITATSKNPPDPKA